MLSLPLFTVFSVLATAFPGIPARQEIARHVRQGSDLGEPFDLVEKATADLKSCE
jgi:hypothetical protein